MTEPSERVHKKDTCWHDFAFTQLEKKGGGPQGDDGVEINKPYPRNEAKIFGVNFIEK